MNFFPAAETPRHSPERTRMPDVCLGGIGAAPTAFRRDCRASTARCRGEEAAPEKKNGIPEGRP